MRLNLPDIAGLDSSQNILIAGMGGGFDVYCGLPIYFALKERGLNVHLANYSFSGVAGLDWEGAIPLTSTLVGITPEKGRPVAGYFPELYLSQWFKAYRGEDVPIWCFQKTGVRPLLMNYQKLIEHLHIDAILLIDGGVDSLMRGDEHEMGTLLEDSISLAAVAQLTDVPLKVVACLGFGAEQDIAYAHALENIARLAGESAFLGTCSLIQQMPAYQAYEMAVLYAQSIPYQTASVINSSVISAVKGHFGNYHLTERTKGSTLSISPLMSLYWFFDLMSLAKHNLLVEPLAETVDFRDSLPIAVALLETRRRRPYKPLGY